MTAALLLAISFVVGGDFVRTLNIVDPHELPSSEESSQGKVHILHERASVPAPGVCDALLAPDAASPIEIEEVPSGKTRILLALDVRVETDLLIPAEERLIGIEVRPAPLDEADVLILKVRRNLKQKVIFREKIGVKDCDEVGINVIMHLQAAGIVLTLVGYGAPRQLSRMFTHLVHSPSFEPLPIGPSDGIDDDSLLPPVVDGLVDNGPCLCIGRVVQHLHLKSVQ